MSVGKELGDFREGRGAGFMVPSTLLSWHFLGPAGGWSCREKGGTGKSQTGDR